MPVTQTRILDLLTARRTQRGPALEIARRVSDQYNGRTVIPVPGLNRRDKPAVANLLKKNIDQYALRVASTFPTIDWPAVKPHIDRSRALAEKRKKASLGWLETNKYQATIMPARAEHLVAYASSPVLIRPDTRTDQPAWDVLSPLATYPAPPTGPQDLTPTDLITVRRRTLAWVAEHYPAQAAMLARHTRTSNLTGDTWVEIVDYWDANEHVRLASGASSVFNTTGDILGGLLIGLAGGKYGLELFRAENRTGQCPAVVPSRIGLDQPTGQMDEVLGLLALQGYLWALEVEAVARGIFPDQWFVHTTAGQGRIVTPADGMAGIVGEIEDGTIQTVNLQPGYTTPQTVDRLERAIQINAGAPSSFNGESSTNIRTDRRGQAILAEAIDYYLYSYHLNLEASLTHELQIAASVDVAYFNQPKSFYLKWPGAKGRVDYTPGDVFGDDKTVVVRYANPGMDQNSETIRNGQKIGLGILSKKTALSMDSTIEDPDAEMARITVEGLEAASLAATQQELTQGFWAPDERVQLLRRVRNGERLEDVTADLLDKRQQAQQAAQGQGQPLPTVGPPSQSMGNLAMALADIRNSSPGRNAA